MENEKQEGAEEWKKKEKEGRQTMRRRIRIGEEEKQEDNKD